MGVFTDYMKLFPINGREFESNALTWEARIANKPGGTHGDRLCYDVEFWRQSFPSNVRTLRLWVSEAGLHIDDRYVPALFEKVRAWLSADQLSGEFAYYG